MQQTITITELLRNHKQVQTMVNNSSEPIAVISNSKIIFTVQQPQYKNTNNQNSAKKWQSIAGIIKKSPTNNTDGAVNHNDIYKI
jgi:hypothetical protein